MKIYLTIFENRDTGEQWPCEHAANRPCDARDHCRNVVNADKPGRWVQVSQAIVGETT